MRYFSKDAKEITYEEWWKNILDHTYCRVARNVYGNTDVCTSWIGLQTSFDEFPVLFCTIVRKFEVEDPVNLMCFWHTSRFSLEEVLEFHHSQVVEVGIPTTRRKAKI